MKWWTRALLTAAALWCGGADLSAQTRADSAAVILHAAEQFRLQGEHAVAQALLQYLQRHYAGTPAAGEVERLRLAMRRVIRPEQSGRTELMVWGSTYGAWLGVALPMIADADGPEAYGFGLLLGAPAGFFAGRAYANATNLTEGQARAITFGGTWGTYQGFALAELFELGDRVADWCTAPEERFCREAHMPTRVAAGVAGGLAGIGVGAVVARKPITAGTAAAVSSAAMWGTWFGWAAGMVAHQEDKALLASTLVGGNAALIAAGLTAPSWEVSENRVRLISVSGLVGGLVGAGIILIAQPEDQAVIVGIPLVTSAIGLAAGVHYTRDMDAPRGGAGGLNGPGGALIRRDNGQWALSVPEPSIRWERGRPGTRPAAYVPLLSARF
jgi:hypothetical protein